MILDAGDVRRFLAGKSVAVVGNSEDALQHAHGKHIDDCDVVLRINAGVPGRAHHDALGYRTDVLSVGNLQVYRESARHLYETPSQHWFVKPTAFGEKQWGKIETGSTRVSPWWRFPVDRWHALAEEIGSSPSGGAVAIHVARLYGAEVNVFGFTFFRGGTWWHQQRKRAMITVKGRPGHHDHVGGNEERWFRDVIGGELVEEGWWRAPGLGPR